MLCSLDELDDISQIFRRVLGLWLVLEHSQLLQAGPKQDNRHVIELLFELIAFNQGLERLLVDLFEV